MSRTTRWPWLMVLLVSTCLLTSTLPMGEAEGRSRSRRSRVRKDEKARKKKARRSRDRRSRKRRRPRPVVTRPAPRPEAPTPAKPWREGVTAEQRKEALDLFRNANKLLLEQQYKEALRTYQQAERIWPHPNIQYNMVRCLVNLDRWREAYLKLKETLRFGQGPLKDEHYQRALEYQKMLKGRVAWITVRCSEPGARVTLDGELLFTGPGEKTLLTKPGSHVVVASKETYVTDSKTVVLEPSKTASLELKLISVASLKRNIVMKRRWSQWMPWTVFGAGVVVAAVGLPLILRGQSEFASFDKYIKTQCAGQPGTSLGCDVASVPDSVTDRESRGKSMNAASIAMFALGGAALAAGVTLVLLNRPRPVEEAPAPPAASGPSGVSVVPAVYPGGAAFQASFRF